jgi:hypothetical protein
MTISTALLSLWASSQGEAGEVDESMKELAAVEALKVEKAEKEVSFITLPHHHL